MVNSKKESPLRDLKSRYRSELVLLDQRKDQRRQQQADKWKIQSIPEIASYLEALKPFLRPVSKAPRPITPIGGSSSSFTVNLGRPASPPSPEPESAVGKGLSAIKGTEKKEKEAEVLIAQCIEVLARMEVEAISLGVELPPRETPDDGEGDPKVEGRGEAFPPADRKAAKSEEQGSETTATNGAKELDPEIPDELVRESTEEWDWDNERTYGAGHTISDAARILNIRRHTLYNWIKKVPIKLTPARRISISEIKRVMTETKQTEDIQA